jgi:hypothetical protein
MNLTTDTCVIMQPTYLPWLGYFDLISKARDFIFLDDVKFNKSSYHHQNKILGVNGVILLSVPTLAKKGRMSSIINEVVIDNSTNWKKKHLMSIEQSYKKAPYFHDIYRNIEEIISSDIEKLSTLNIKIIKLIASILSLNTKFYMASDLEIFTENKVQRLINFCKIRECSSYLSPVGSLDYIDTIENKALFNSNNIDVFFQNFDINPYTQRNQEFIPHMSILDALMNCGAEGTKSILEKSHNISKFN